MCNGYTLFRYDRTFEIGRGGGVLIGVADSTNIKVSNVSKIDDGELLAINVDVSGFS